MMNFNVLFPIFITFLIVIGYIGRKFLPDPPPKAIGIDLGTSYSSVGAFYSGKGEVKIFTDSHGKSLIPSIVTYTDKSIIVGHQAVNISMHYPTSTFFEFKRVIGRKNMSSEDVEQNLSKENLNYNLVDGEVFFVKNLSNGNQNFNYENNLIKPEELSCEVLKYLKNMAFQAIGSSVMNVVLGVPVEFDSNQRDATISAAKKAGLNVLRLVNEPTAAAMAYGLHTKPDIHYILVFDLGGGTLDVSVLNVDGNMFITQSIAGNNHLGGRDFTLNLYRYSIEKIKNIYQLNCFFNDKFMMDLKIHIENAKRQLSSLENIEITIENPCKTVENIKLILTRQEFEQINAENFKNLMKPIIAVLKGSQLSTKQIDEIVLVGGSTRMPKLRQDLTEFFNKPPNIHVDPDLAVVTGLAIQAGILSSGWPLPVSALDIVNSNLKREEL